MRFHGLQIPAFGPFTNLELEFRKDPADLHVIYGPNEAGKSSLLRAIRDLLFGIPGQSSDDFLHKYADLKIRAEISNRANEKLVFQRRKGNKNTLQDGVGNVLPDNVLARFLGGVDERYFSAMFGLGARELHEGARQLLSGEGELGQALFSASLGGTPIQKVVAALRDECERLYKGRSLANVSIRPAVTRYRELVKLSREVLVNADDWMALERELAAAQETKRAMEEQVAGSAKEIAWIARCEGALPIVGRLTEAMDGLKRLPVLPELASDFSTRARVARADLSRQNLEVQRLSARLGQLRSEHLALPEAPALLGHAEMLERLHEDLGAYREAKRTWEELKTKGNSLELLLRAGMDKLELKGDFASVATCRLSSPARLTFEAAAHELRAVQAEAASQTRKVKELKEQIEDAQTELGGLAEIDLLALREGLTAAEGAIDADRTFAVSQAEVKRLTRGMAGRHQQVSGAPPDWEAAAQLCVPSVATIRQFQERLDGFKRELRACQKNLCDGESRFDGLQAELGRLSRQGELPTEEALRAAREYRDHGWNLVLAQWKGSGAKEDLELGVPLEEAFPKAIRRADAIADTLRLEADAVAQAEQKQGQLAETQKQITLAKDASGQLQAALDQCQREWESEWSSCGIVPRSPVEMLEWRDSWTVFKEELAKLRTAQDVLESKQSQILKARVRLANALGRSDETEFSVLFERAKAQVQEAEERRGRRREIIRQLNRSEGELAKFERSRSELLDLMQGAAQRWKTQCQELGLPSEISPDGGLLLLRERQELLANFDQWQEVARSQKLIDEKIHRYEEAVGQRADALGIAGPSTESLESAMWKHLGEARKFHAGRTNLAEQIAKMEIESIAAQNSLAQSEQALRDLVALAHLGSPEDLEGFLAHLEQRKVLETQIHQLRSDLIGLAGTGSVDEFVGRVRAQNLDELRERKAKAERAKIEIESALAGIRETVFRLTSRKAELEKAEDAAAYGRQQAESCAAGLQQDVARYMRLRLATHVLEHQIERFRKENQGPLLQRTGELFSAITQGAFSTLAAEVSAQDLPVLTGVRPTGEKVFVEGLSHGARDQLYLALRLAALERHLQEHEPMPLVLDDLLITFDDTRTMAILPILAQLSEHTQIFLLTHHNHLVELCQRSLGEARFHLHTLGAGQRPDRIPGGVSSEQTGRLTPM